MPPIRPFSGLKEPILTVKICQIRLSLVVPAELLATVGEDSVTR